MYDKNIKIFSSQTSIKTQIFNPEKKLSSDNQVPNIENWCGGLKIFGS